MARLNKWYSNVIPVGNIFLLGVERSIYLCLFLEITDKRQKSWNFQFLSITGPAWKQLLKMETSGEICEYSYFTLQHFPCWKDFPAVSASFSLSHFHLVIAAWHTPLQVLYNSEQFSEELPLIHNIIPASNFRLSSLQSTSWLLCQSDFSLVSLLLCLALNVDNNLLLHPEAQVNRCDFVIRLIQ